jgi:cyclophilin family peptidyl-prolyl cis-trans isomerase
MTYVRMTTSAGEIDIELYTDECPDTTANFLKLVDDEFYYSLHFLRTINTFMIQ